MEKIIYAEGFFNDLERIVDFIKAANAPLCEETVTLIYEAVSILQRHPNIGRPAEHGLKELLISQGRNGYVALYRFRQDLHQIRILALRHQREAGYADDKEANH
jgi:plasmid stabilization system protein ParE